MVGVDTVVVRGAVATTGRIGAFCRCRPTPPNIEDILGLKPEPAAERIREYRVAVEVEPPLVATLPAGGYRRARILGMPAAWQRSTAKFERRSHRAPRRLAGRDRAEDRWIA
jgi:hypothetical protein